jgi:hypothetical protein
MIRDEIYAVDASEKVFKGQRMDGARVLNTRVTVMGNTCGTIDTAFNAKSNSMDDPAAVLCFNDRQKLDATRPQTMIVYIDNPYRDLNGTERRFNLKTTSISPTFNFEGEEKCVGSQDETLALDLAWLFAEGEVKEAKEVELAIESSILHSNSVRMPLGSPAAAASATSFTGNAVPFPPATLAPGATSSSSRSSISSINSSSSSMLPPALPSLTPAPACPLTSADKLSTNHSVIVGFDLEWAPSYQTGVSPGKVALMQLCTGRRTLVVRLHKCAQLPKALTALFQKPGLIFTGVNIASDFSKFFADFVDETHELAALEAKITNDAVDLRAMATRLLHLDARLWSLQKLVSVVLGKHLNKEIDHRQWANENLTDYQIKYAVNDAAAHFNVYQALETNRQPLEPDSKDSPSPDSKFDDAKFDETNEFDKKQAQAAFVTANDVLGAEVQRADAEELESEERPSVPPPPYVRNSSKELYDLIGNVLANFVDSPDFTHLELPRGMTPDQRRRVHELAEALQIDHQSVDEGLDRRIILKRKETKAVSPSDADSCNANWRQLKIKYDVKHLLKNLFLMAKSNSPFYGAFCSMLADAIMVPLPGERERVSEHFRRLGMSDEQINQIRRKVWRGRIRHTILEPERLYPRIKSTVVFFSFLRDPDTGTRIALVHNKNDIYR